MKIVVGNTYQWYCVMWSLTSLKWIFLQLLLIGLVSALNLNFIFLFSHAVVIYLGPAKWFSFFAFLQSQRNFPLLSMKAVLWDSLEIVHTDTPFACASSVLVKPSDLRLCYWYDECISEHPNMCSKLHCLECFLIS